MKSQKDFRTNHHEAADIVRKAIKLDPIRKSGKEKHEIFKGLNQEPDEEEEDYKFLTKRESVLDYMGDEEDEEEYDDDELDEQDEDYDEGEDDEEEDEDDEKDEGVK